MKYIDDHFSQEYIDYLKKLKNPDKLVSSGVLSQCSNNDATDPFAGNSAEISLCVITLTERRNQL